MRPAGSTVWLRALGVVLALFALGHTIGTASPKVTRGAAEGAVFFAMQHFTFPVMGFERSHWDFYRGFAISVSVLMAVMALVAWQLSTIARHSPAQAMPMTMTLLAGCVGLLVLCWSFFFWPPIVFSIAAVACAAAAMLRLRQEMRTA